MCTEIDKHCEIGHMRLLLSSIETENQLSYCGSTIVENLLHLLDNESMQYLSVAKKVIM